MKILFVCRFLPHPNVRDSGGQDAYHYIAALSEQHTVSLTAFVTQGQGEAVKAMRGVCHEVVTVPYQPHALLPRLWRAWWRLLMPRVYGRAFSLRYRARLRDLLARERFDVAVVDGMMAQYGGLLRGVKRVLDEIDVYSVVAYHIYRAQNNSLLRLQALLDWLRTWIFELHYAGSYDGVLVRSEKDRLVLCDHLPRQKIAVIPPWFEGLDELRSIAPRRPEGNHLLYVGAMNLPANIEAVCHFARDVLPWVQRQVPDAKFWIVGADPPPQVQSLNNERDGVVVVEEVPQLKPYYERCAVNVVPLLRGGGVIVKTLNGLAAARPTVATLLGNSGTGAEPGRHVLVADEAPQAFAQAVVRLLTDEGLWHRMAHSGRKFVVDEYDWAAVTRRLVGFLESVVHENRHLKSPHV